MPIPGSILNGVINPGMMSAVADLYPSVCTFSVLVVTKGTTGQEIHSFIPSTDPTLSNLKCRKVPLRTDRIQEQESSEGSDIQRTQGNFRLGLQTYITVAHDTLIQWRVVVDGTTYEIQSVEEDGSKVTTRLMLADWKPFNP